MTENLPRHRQNSSYSRSETAALIAHPPSLARFSSPCGCAVLDHTPQQLGFIGRAVENLTVPSGTDPPRSSTEKVGLPRWEVGSRPEPKSPNYRP